MRIPKVCILLCNNRLVPLQHTHSETTDTMVMFHILCGSCWQTWSVCVDKSEVEEAYSIDRGESGVQNLFLRKVMHQCDHATPPTPQRTMDALSNTGGAGTSTGWVNNAYGGFSVCKCSGCQGVLYGKNIHRLINITETYDHGYVLHGVDGKETVVISTIKHIERCGLSLEKFMTIQPPQQTDIEDKEESYTFTMDELTRLLLRTSGKYKSMQDQAEAIMNYLKAKKGTN